MPFPQELNKADIRQLIAFVTGSDKDVGRLVLAIYNLTGFGLGKAFPDANYMMLADPELMAELQAIDADKLREILKELGIVIGPIVMRLILRYLEK